MCVLLLKLKTVLLVEVGLEWTFSLRENVRPRALDCLEHRISWLDVSLDFSINEHCCRASYTELEQSSVPFLH